MTSVLKKLNISTSNFSYSLQLLGVEICKVCQITHFMDLVVFIICGTCNSVILSILANYSHYRTKTLTPYFNHACTIKLSFEVLIIWMFFIKNSCPFFVFCLFFFLLNNFFNITYDPQNVFNMRCNHINRSQNMCNSNAWFFIF